MRKRKYTVLATMYYLIGVAISTFLIMRKEYLWVAPVLLLFYFSAHFFGKIASKRRFDGIVIGLLHLGSGQAPKSFIIRYFVDSAPRSDLGHLERLVESTIERLEKKGRIEVKGDVICRIS